MLYSTYYIEKCNKRNTRIDYKFVEWINEVETIIKIKTGSQLLEYPDENYMINFESGYTTTEMVEIILYQLEELFLL